MYQHTKMLHEQPATSVTGWRYRLTALVPSDEARSALRRLSCGMVEVAMPKSRADRLRQLAEELFSLADADEHPSRSVDRADMLIAEGERIAKAVWVEYRG